MEIKRKAFKDLSNILDKSIKGNMLDDDSVTSRVIDGDDSQAIRAKISVPSISEQAAAIAVETARAISVEGTKASISSLSAEQAARISADSLKQNIADDITTNKVGLGALKAEVLAVLSGGETFPLADRLGDITALTDNLADPSSNNGKWYYVNGVTGTMTGTNPPSKDVTDGGYVYSNGTEWLVRAPVPTFIPDESITVEKLEQYLQDLAQNTGNEPFYLEGRKLSFALTTRASGAPVALMGISDDDSPGELVAIIPRSSLKADFADLLPDDSADVYVDGIKLDQATVSGIYLLQSYPVISKETPDVNQEDRPLVSVVDLGYSFSGSGNELAILEAAYAQAKTMGCDLYLPSGSYHFTGKFVGYDPSSCVIRAASDAQITGLWDGAVIYDPDSEKLKSYTVPSIEVTQITVSPLGTNGYLYQHDACIAKYDGYYFYFFNANTNATEGQGGQKNVGRRSFTFAGLASANTHDEFTNSAYSSNPIVPESNTVGWQPGLYVTPDGSKLYCLQCYSSIDRYTGTYPAPPSGYLSADNCYLSVLTSGSGKWTNYRFLFADDGTITLSSNVSTALTDGSNLYKSGGHKWLVFPAQSPYRMLDGETWWPVILCKVGIVTGWWGNQALSNASTYGAYLVTKDFSSWRMVERCEGKVPLRANTNWEPFASQRNDGSIVNFVRYTGYGGTTELRGTGQITGPIIDDVIEPMSATGHEMSITRGQAIRLGGKRWGMLINDNEWINGNVVASDRKNLAMWISRDGENFTPGITIPVNNTTTAQYYPCADYDGDSLIVAATKSGDMEAYRFTPQISDSAFYAIPRYNAYDQVGGSYSWFNNTSGEFGIYGFGSVALETEGDRWTIFAQWRFSRAPVSGDGELWVAMVGDALANVAVVRKTDGTLVARRFETKQLQPTATSTTTDYSLPASSDVTVNNSLVIGYNDGVVTINGVTIPGTYKPRPFLGRGLFGQATLSSLTRPDIYLYAPLAGLKILTQ